MVCQDQTDYPIWLFYGRVISLDSRVIRRREKRSKATEPFDFAQGHEPVELPFGFAQGRELVERQMMP